MKKKINRILYYVLLVIFVLTFSISVFFIIKYTVDGKKQDDIYQNLSEEIDKQPVNQILPEKSNSLNYDKLFAINPHSVGWISVSGTIIDYPLMKSVESPNFYLNHSYDRSYSRYGCPYVQENCDVDKPSDNIIIYGHNMRDGRMFGALEKYLDKSFFEQNRYIDVNIKGQDFKYEILSVFTQSEEAENRFAYHLFVDAEDEVDFSEYVDKCKSLSRYDTGVDAVYGDKLITISTCEYSSKNGRLVIVAKKII